MYLVELIPRKLFHKTIKQVTFENRILKHIDYNIPISLVVVNGLTSIFGLNIIYWRLVRYWW
ncbi:hypothetical protein FD41_GL001741 [Lentilactobacillus farraginis DSM 18382 = JCM 14108]|uniref:Uncharacterized protein n=1 Tax=Lentilactobacillus farraginis DSM 18382 = JCM 14108 TaxID=1423743 RepID=A0A0R1W4R9_9LACO|nr:hypothetical protein FD41_GL001741 [Lentilactobacillus farraginis DSM 18382 = JCM 14108]